MSHTITIQVRVPRALADRLDAQVEALRRKGEVLRASRSTIMRLALVEWLRGVERAAG